MPNNRSCTNLSLDPYSGTSLFSTLLVYPSDHVVVYFYHSASLIYLSMRRASSTLPSCAQASSSLADTTTHMTARAAWLWRIAWGDYGADVAWPAWSAHDVCQKTNEELHGSAYIWRVGCEGISFAYLVSSFPGLLLTKCWNQQGFKIKISSTWATLLTCFFIFPHADWIAQLTC